MAESLRHRQASAVTAGRRDREAAGCEDHAIALKRPAGCGDRESAGADRQIGHRGVETRLDAFGTRIGDEAVTDVARAVRSRKQLAGFLLERQRDLEVALEERALF